MDLAANLDSDLRQMSWLFEDLRAFCWDLISIPESSEERAMLKKFKIDQKELERKLQLEHSAKVKAERAASKLALKMEKNSMGESKMEE